MSEEENLPLSEEESPREDPRERFRRLLEQSGEESGEQRRELEEGRPPTWDTPPSGIPRPPDPSEEPTERLDLQWGSGASALPDEEAAIPISQEITPTNMAVPRSEMDQPADESGGSVVEKNSAEVPGPTSTPPSDESAPAAEAHDTPPAPPNLGKNRLQPPPAVDAQGMPLPRRVDQIDVHGTRVSPAAYEAPPPPRPAPRRPPPRERSMRA